MNNEKMFKEFVSQYCEVAPEDMTDEMRFREDLGFSSFDFMAFMGELEDNFDIELDESLVVNIRTIGEALNLLKMIPQEA